MFRFRLAVILKIFAENQWNPCTIVHGFFVNLGAIFRVFKTCLKRSLGTPEKLWVVLSEAHAFRFRLAVILKIFDWKSKKSMYYSTWVFVNLVAIFRIFETCPKCSLGTPEKLWVVSSEANVSFQIGGDFKNFAENQWNPCTIVHGFLSIWVRFSEFSKLVQNVP